MQNMAEIIWGTSNFNPRIMLTKVSGLPSIPETSANLGTFIQLYSILIDRSSDEIQKPQESVFDWK